MAKKFVQKSLKIFSKSEAKRFETGFKKSCIFQVLFCLASLFLSASCNFQVIYKDEYKSGSFSSELAAIRIKKNRDMLDQKMRNNLYDVLNPDFLKVEPLYFLEVSLTSTTSDTFITSTGASGRKRVLISATYQLKNLKNLAVISSGTTEANDNYDISSNRYGTLVADQYIKNNLTKIIAQNIRNSIVNDFVEIRHDCQNPPSKNFICPLSKL